MFISWLKRFRAATAEVASRYLCSRSDFLQRLERERLRSDRNRTHLALLTIQIVPTGSNAQEFGKVAEMLRSRLRATDDVGWWERDCLAVLLPDTDKSGAEKVARDVRASLIARNLAAQMRLLIYPSEPQATGPADGSDEGNRETEPLTTLFERPLPAWKRLIDVTGATMGLILLSPLMLLAAIAIKLSSPGRVLFDQERSGLGGRPFRMYKFRTMIAGADAIKDRLRSLSKQDGPAFKMALDPRVTRVGLLLRKTSIDELPQLWNVFRGEMSLVGPRPLPCEESEASERWHRRRLDITPGLTCVWQVYGRSAVSFVEWMRMDMQYARSRSFTTDMKLIVWTVPAILLGRGAH